MKMIKDISELKKGDNIIVKDSPSFVTLGFRSIRGDVFNVEPSKSHIIIRCKETENFEEMRLGVGVIFLID